MKSLPASNCSSVSVESSPTASAVIRQGVVAVRTIDRLLLRSLLVHVLLLAAAAELLFFVNLRRPNQMMFDETHYVPAARATFGMLERVNVEHPLFAKWLIGLSMFLFGDTPWGWRVLSTVAGTATVVAVFMIALAMFRDRFAATIAALAVLLNQILFIQARIAMLDVFMGAFLLGGMAFALWARQCRGHTRLTLLAAGVCLGLAVGCKWTALPYVGLVCAAALVRQWRDPSTWPGLSRLAPALLVGVSAILAYFATFTPAFFYAQNPLPVEELVTYHSQMVGMQTQVPAPHPYMSPWWKWALAIRPIWYLYERVDGPVRGVLLIGNPAIMWGGLAAVVVCLRAGIKGRDAALLWAAGLYLFSLGVWIVIPKKIGFYYYYHLSALFLGFALAGAFHHFRARRSAVIFLGMAAVLFVYFLPIISARALPDDQAFLRWTWFKSWR